MGKFVEVKVLARQPQPRRLPSYIAVDKKAGTCESGTRPGQDWNNWVQCYSTCIALVSYNLVWRNRVWLVPVL